MEDSEALARHLGIRCDTLPITDAFGVTLNAWSRSSPEPGPIARRRICKARLRGLYLMALANKRGHLLLSTGNESELSVGYCTIYGDMCGGFALLSDLPKTRVIRLARWLNREKKSSRGTASASHPARTEAGPEGSGHPAALRDPGRHPRSSAWNGSCPWRKSWNKATMRPRRAVQRRVELNEWKRHQAAPGIRVTTKAFGPGRRMPIAQAFG